MSKKPAESNKISISDVTVRFFGTMALVAGFINATGVINFADERLGIKKRAHNISHGEALAMLILSMTYGKYTAIYDLIHSFLSKLSNSHRINLQLLRQVLISIVMASRSHKYVMESQIVVTLIKLL